MFSLVEIFNRPFISRVTTEMSTGFANPEFKDKEIGQNWGSKVVNKLFASR